MKQASSRVDVSRKIVVGGDTDYGVGCNGVER